MALPLERRGITRVHPLHGGIAKWVALGFPVREAVIPALPTPEGSRQP